MRSLRMHQFGTPSNVQHTVPGQNSEAGGEPPKKGTVFCHPVVREFCNKCLD